jgi:molecular chaperone DnaJ
MITNPCNTCQSQGSIERERQLEVKIPAGVDTGARLRLAGEGEASQSAGPAGDLYVVIHVKEHDLFQRQGNNLYVNVPVTFTQAVLGAEIRVPTLEGEETLTIPEGAQTDSIFRLKGKGVISLQGHGRGDLFGVITIITPTQLTKEQKQLLEEFAVIEDKLSRGPTRRFGGRVKDIFG